tara:strand:- start:1025 stop:1744 length:720 start_codon:yes stop_codon:yes gene_type:complete
MTIYILSSNKSIHAVEAMQYFINKYYISNPRVKVLSYDYPENFKFAENFELISMGVDEGPDHVTKKLYECMSKIKDEHFIFTVDDFLPIELIDTKLIEMLYKKMKTDNIPRISLNNDFSNKNYSKIDNINGKNLLYLNDKVTYPGKISAIWSMWSKKFFLESIKSANNLWDWERSGNTKQRSILGVSDGVINTCHLFKHARLRKDWQTIVDSTLNVNAVDKIIIENFLNKWKSEGVIQL